jgi:dTDP-4-amino-4,6-dideoxygalactose transaminase
MIRLSKSIVGKKESSAVSKVIANGYLGMGNETMLFEEEIADFIGVNRTSVCTVNTGTSALHLACQFLFNEADEVLVPSITYVASHQAIATSGATPISVEVNLKDGLIDLNDAKKRITKNTKGMMYVHYGSNTGDLDKVEEFCKSNNLKLIHDAAHSFGCSYKNKKVGFKNGVYCFSFDGIKNITSGEGGCIISNNLNLINFCNDARLLGVQKDTEMRFQGKRSYNFDVTHEGYRYHLSNINSAIGRVQLERFQSEFKEKRQRIYKTYLDFFKNIKNIENLYSDTNCDIVPHIMPVLFKSIELKKSAEYHLKEKNIQFGYHYFPNHLLTKFKTNYSLPVSEDFHNRQLTLPLHPGLNLKDLKIIFKILKNI